MIAGLASDRNRRPPTALVLAEGLETIARQMEASASGAWSTISTIGGSMAPRTASPVMPPPLPPESTIVTSPGSQPSTPSSQTALPQTAPPQQFEQPDQRSVAFPAGAPASRDAWFRGHAILDRLRLSWPAGVELGESAGFSDFGAAVLRRSLLRERRPVRDEHDRRLTRRRNLPAGRLVLRDAGSRRARPVRDLDVRDHPAAALTAAHRRRPLIAQSRMWSIRCRSSSAVAIADDGPPQAERSSA